MIRIGLGPLEETLLGGLTTGFLTRWSTQRSEDVPRGPQLAAKTVSGPILLSHPPSEHWFSSVLQVSGTARPNVFETPTQKVECLHVRQQP